jgi:hypothetical protein
LLQFLYTRKNSIAIHCNLSFLWVDFVLTFVGKSLFMNEHSIPLESLWTQFPFSSFILVTWNLATSHDSFPFLLQRRVSLPKSPTLLHTHFEQQLKMIVKLAKGSL